MKINDTQHNPDFSDDLQEITLANLASPGQERINRENYYKALYCLHQNNLTEAKKHLLDTLSSTEPEGSLYNRSLSYLGLVEVIQHNSNGGLHRCYEAEKSYFEHPDIQLNIAYAEFRLGNRKRCINAIFKCLKHSPNNPQANHFYECIGKRKKRNTVRSIFGRFLRKNNISADECFIKAIQKNLSINH